MTNYSEAVLISSNVLFDFFKVRKALEDAILEHTVELVLDARQHGILFVDVKAELLE